MTNPVVIGVDVGYGNVKCVYGQTADRLGRKRWEEICFGSVTPDALMDEEAMGMGNPQRVLISCNGKAYYAGPAASNGVVARALDPNYIETDQHEVLLRAALHFAMRDMGRVVERLDTLVLGLPVSGYVASHERLAEIGSRPREVPLPRNLISAGGKTSVIVQAKTVLVRPQPFGALTLAAQTASEDDPMFDTSSLTMVIDPGYRTFDWFVASGFHPELSLSGSFDGGVSSIYRELSQRIGFQHGTGSLEFDQIERGLRTGEIKLLHKNIDMRPFVSMAKALADQQISAFLARIDSNKSNVGRILLAGGGAALYEQSLRERMHGVPITVMADSVMANARGYWLDGCFENGVL